MNVNLGSIHENIFNYATPFIKFIDEKCEKFNKDFRPIFLLKCDQYGEQLADRIDKPEMAALFSTVLKILPLTLFISTLSLCLSAPAVLALSGLACVVSVTHHSLFSKEGKKIILQSCAAATLINTIYKVGIAISQFGLGTAMGSLMLGGWLAAVFYTAATMKEK